MGSMTPDWLTQLAPAHAPPPPGWWPLATGWWAIIIFLVVITVALVYWQSRPAVRLRRIALRELKNLHASNIDDISLAQALENLLRRYALARYGRDTVASLSGERWINFVVAHGATTWTGECGASLLRIAYGGEATANRVEWLSGAQAFIKGRT